MAYTVLNGWLEVKAHKQTDSNGRNHAKAPSRVAALKNSGHACSETGQAPPARAASSFLATLFNPTGRNSFSRRFRGQGCGSGGVKFSSAFTLVEALMALGVLVIFVGACMSAILTNQVSTRKSKEEAIAMDFLTKYAENIKALPFTSVAVGQPINEYFDGTHGAPLIAIPAASSWVSVNTNSYQLFYPDFVWFNNRNPQIMVTLTPNTVSGTLHDIEVNVKLDWDPPLSKGARQEVQVDFLRTKDTTQL